MVWVVQKINLQTMATDISEQWSQMFTCAMYQINTFSTFCQELAAFSTAGEKRPT